MTMPTKTEIAEVSNKIREAIRSAIEGTGYELKKSNVTYEETELRMRVELFKPAVAGEIAEAGEWRKYQTIRELPCDLGFEIEMNGRPVVIAGYNPRASRRAVIVRDPATDKLFTTDEDTMRRMVDKAQKVAA